MKFKECACCHRLLDESCFSKNARNKDGLHSYCRECNKNKAKAFNSTKDKTYFAKYKLKQIESGYYRFGHGAYVNMKKSAEKRNIDFTITEEELKRWWLSNNDVCFYCGVDVKEFKDIRDFIITYNGTNTTILNIKNSVFNKSIYKKINTMTIDRIDSFGPYSVGNIVKSCWICNSLKSNTLSKDEMMVKGHEILEEIRRVMKNGKQ